MRTGITVTGVIVLIVGLIVAGLGAYYTASPYHLASEWAGAIVTVIGLIAGIAGAAMSKPMAKPAAAPSAPPAAAGP